MMGNKPAPETRRERRIAGFSSPIQSTSNGNAWIFLIFFFFTFSFLSPLASLLSHVNGPAAPDLTRMAR